MVRRSFNSYTSTLLSRLYQRTQILWRAIRRVQSICTEQLSSINTIYRPELMKRQNLLEASGRIPWYLRLRHSPCTRLNSYTSQINGFIPRNPLWTKILTSLSLSPIHPLMKHWISTPPFTRVPVFKYLSNFRGKITARILGKIACQQRSYRNRDLRI
jgi:hypothetical protein